MATPMLAGRRSRLAAADDERDRFIVESMARYEEIRRLTPAIYEGAGHAELVINAAPFIQGYDPSNGKELWRLGPISTNTTPTPIVGEGLIFVANGYNPIKPIYAVVPGSHGDLTLKEGAAQSDAIAWSNLRDGG